MTENDYLLSKLTTRYKLCGHSIWLPLAFILLMIIGAAYELPFVPVQRFLLMCFIITFVIAIICRQALSKKIMLWKDEYQKIKHLLR